MNALIAASRSRLARPSAIRHGLDAMYSQPIVVSVTCNADHFCSGPLGQLDRDRADPARSAYILTAGLPERDGEFEDREHPKLSSPPS